MKGQILLTPQSTRFNSYLLCALFIAMTVSIEHRALAAESTNSHRRNSIVVPADPATDENLLVINPSSTNRVRQDGSIIGSTNISDSHEMLQLYADIRGRTIRYSTNLSLPNLSFTADKPLTRDETTLALDASFGLNGIALIDIGEKWVHAAPSESCQTASNLMHQTEYLTHLEHLIYLTPSDLVPTLQPFSSGAANAVVSLNAEQAVLLRDFPQNVQKMQDVIRELDVAIPTEFISEVIPIKYAKASEIAAALNKSGPLEWRASHRPAAEKIVVSGQDKLIADERTNSLLVYASREEMKQIKEIISHLDILAAQILIEAVVIEVNRDNDLKFSAIDNEKVPWMTNFVSNLSTNATPSANSAPEAGFYRLAPITNDLDTFVTILATNNSVKILQRPRIQTSDGEPAQLFVGEARQLPNQAYYSGGAGCGVSSIQMVNLGVTLEFTPTITNDQLLALDIHQTIEQANGSVTIANVGDVPITRRSERSAKIAVRDRDLVLLDGSIERENSTRPGKFQDEIIMLIRPTILPPPEVAQLSKAEKDKMPGVKRVQTEIQIEEANRLKQLEKNLQSGRDLTGR
jgi:Bacterial type II and III secretion system protein/Bacterial type II/III secretion system short domain